MRSSTYEKEIKDTHCVYSTEDPTVDKMDILMDSISKRNDKWVEWTGDTRKRTGATSSFASVFGGAQTTSTTTSTIATTTSTSMGPSQLVG